MKNSIAQGKYENVVQRKLVTQVQYNDNLVQERTSMFL